MTGFGFSATHEWPPCKHEGCPSLTEVTQYTHILRHLYPSDTPGKTQNDKKHALLALSFVPSALPDSRGSTLTPPLVLVLSFRKG